MVQVEEEFLLILLFIVLVHTQLTWYLLILYDRPCKVSKGRNSRWNFLYLPIIFYYYTVFDVYPYPG